MSDALRYTDAVTGENAIAGEPSVTAPVAVGTTAMRAPVTEIDISCGDRTMTFRSGDSSLTYPLTVCDIPPGPYTAEAGGAGQALELTLNELSSGSLAGPPGDYSEAARMLQGQRQVSVNVTAGHADPAPPVPPGDELPLVGSIETGWRRAVPPEPQPDPVAPGDESEPRTLGDEFVAGFGEQTLEGIVGVGLSAAEGFLRRGDPVYQVEQAFNLFATLHQGYEDYGGGLDGLLAAVNTMNPVSTMLKGFHEAESEAEQALYLASLGDVEGAREHARESGRAGARYMGGSLELGTMVAGGVAAKGHGNLATSPKLTRLYALYDRKTGQFLKWGVTGTDPPLNRYSGKQNRYYMRVLAEGDRARILSLERELTERLPGRANDEAWSGMNSGPQLPLVQSFLDWAWPKTAPIKIVP
jgi:hypothetical protein